MALTLLGTHSQLPATRSRGLPAREDAPGPLLDTTSIPLFDSSISEPIYSSGHRNVPWQWVPQLHHTLAGQKQLPFVSMKSVSCSVHNMFCCSYYEKQQNCFTFSESFLLFHASSTLTSLLCSEISARAPQSVCSLCCTNPSPYHYSVLFFFPDTVFCGIF